MSRKLSYDEIVAFYNDRMESNHGDSYYTRLDGTRISTDVGYFVDCMINGFLPDLKMFMED